ncbi:MAG: hypothetical protein Q9191_007923 [Dirinaria sp. TL-2023a]
MGKRHPPTGSVPADPSLRRRLNVPKRRSSQNALTARPASARGLTTPSSSQQRQSRTIPSRGRSTSPIRPHGRVGLRRAPSRTFVPPVLPTDILEFPRVHHPRIAVAIGLSAPLCVGGATVEGDVHLTIDGGKPIERNKGRTPMSMGRVVISLIGVEYCNGRQWIFQTLATDLIDEDHPPPAEMLAEGFSASDTVWEARPSVSSLPFRLDLPVYVGPAPYKARKLGIKYLLSTTVEIRVDEKIHFARVSQEIAVLTVHDRMCLNVTTAVHSDMRPAEKALVNLSSPLVASDELHIPRAGVSASIKLTAGLHRQTWISGYIVFVDILVVNGSHKKVDKIEILLEKATLLYKSAASSQSGITGSLRLPDQCIKEVVTRKTMKGPQDAVFPNSEVIRTCRLELPIGLVSVETGRFFGVRFFLSVRISCSFSKRLMVELPITIIHPSSVDIPPNSLAQVAAAVEHKHRDHLFKTGSPYRYTAGRAFAAARERSYDRVKASTLPSPELRDVALQLDGSPRRRKVQHRRSHMVLGSRSTNNTTTADTRAMRPTSSRPQTSLDIYGPRLQRSTSGLVFDDDDDDSDKENQPALQPPPSSKTVGNNNNNENNMKNRPFSRVEDSVLRELDLARKRSSTLSSGWKNVAAEAKVVM